MIDNFVAVTNAGNVGLAHDTIQKNRKKGEETHESKEARFRKILEDEREKVLSIYNSKGKIIDSDKYGRHLNVFA